MLIEQLLNLNRGGLGPLVIQVIHVLLQLVMFMTKQKYFPRKSSRGLFFTDKILHEAMYRAFSYLGQITYKI